MRVMSRCFSTDIDSLTLYLMRWTENDSQKRTFVLEIPYIVRVFFGDMPDITAKSGYQSSGFTITKETVIDFVCGPLRTTLHADVNAQVRTVSHWGKTGTYVNGVAIQNRPRFTKPIKTDSWICKLDNEITFDIPIAKDPVIVIQLMIELGAAVRGEEPE